jgi:ubiquinone/menaquinone biosynthesis C-methylase UbiE
MRELNAAKAEAFAGRMVGILNDALIALMTSIGHQTRLFDTMAELGPATSEGIAQAAGLNERYVREWLGAMVTGEIVEYDAAERRYHLPAEHAASLTRDAGSGNLATMTQFVSCMGNVEQGIVDCFRNGGGLSYSAYDRFHRIMAEESAQTFDETLIQRTIPAVPGLAEQLDQGIGVLDVGCGSGHAINVMARAFPSSRFAGYDFSPEAIAAARSEAAAWGLSNARFEVRDVTNLAPDETFDFITAFDSIHDQAKPRDVLCGIARALREGGTFLMVDIDGSSRVEDNVGRPLAPFIYAVSTLHCMSVSLGQNGEGLGAAWGEQKARELLAEAGFTQVDAMRVEGDIINCYYVARK